VATDAPHQGPDAALLRRTRLRLIAWSGGLTLLILVLLGGAVYSAVARSLEDRGTALVEQRAEEIVRFLERPGMMPGRPFPGMTFGRQTSGTLALYVRPDGGAVLGADLGDIEGIPDESGVEAARREGRDVRTSMIEEVPVRVYSEAVERRDGWYVVQVLGERASEQRLLDALAAVLAVGGLLAVLAATGAGYVYAGRALVPIRDSMGRRDEALRRQREFTANASHELRTPLTVIGTSVTDLRRNPREPVASVGSALDDIDAGVNHLTALVDDLLLLARTDSGALELDRVPLDLGDLAAEAVGTLTPLAASKGVSLVADPRPVALVGDPLRLRQLIAILVDNAVAHSPAGGSVTVGVRTEGDQAILAVEDEGPGLREEDLQHVFERFWRADDAPAGGTGLGLSIAAWIVERHGGSISAANRPAGGARLEARLPRAGARAPGS
jgi:signal transduction histidine kinase